MLSRTKYVEILNKMLVKNLSPKLVGIIINDDQLYGNLLTAIMIADWKGELKSGVGHQSYGYRQLGFKWEIGRIKREFYYHKKYKICEYENFNGVADHKTEVEDGNLFYEEFVDAIKKSKVLKTKEKEYLTKLFIDLKPLPDKEVDKKRAQSNINRGLSKLNEQYSIFKPTRIRTNCKKNSKCVVSKDIGMDI